MANHRDGTNYYEILEVAHDAPQNEIHKAYQRAKATYSQESPALYSMFSKDEARELLRMIEEAYAVLGNQALRKSYDEKLAQSGPPSNGIPTHPVPLTTAAKPTIESVHKSLPDFHAPSSTPSETVSAVAISDPAEAFTVRKRESSHKANVPTGMGRTNLSTYKLDETFESEIASCTDFDGAFLQKVRLYKNISIDKISEATRIGRTYLMAVETNDYKALPAAVFVRGFIVQIARALNLDETKVAGTYMKRFKDGGGK